MKRFVILLAILALMLPVFAETVQIGGGTDTVNYFPIYGLYNYSYSQQVYTQSQIGVSGEISKIRFYYVSGSIANSYQWTIYMGHSTRTEFSGGNDWESPNNLSQVFSGNVTNLLPVANNWMEITLDTDFFYNNTDNLIVAVLESSPNYTDMIWGAFTSDRNSGIHYFNDNNPINLNALPPAQRIRNAINRIQLVFPDAEAPGAPLLVAPANGATRVENPVLIWTSASSGGDATHYDLYIGANETPRLVAEDLELRSYVLQNWEYSTVYNWKVVAKNAGGVSPESETWSFTTREDPVRPLPYTQDFESGTSLSAIKWTGNMEISSNHGTDGSNGLNKALFSLVTSANADTPPIGPLAENIQIIFDYRYVAYGNYPNYPFTLSPGNKLELQIFVDGDFETIHTIDHTNHITSADFANVIVDLSGYEALITKFRFLATWAAGDYIIDIDNVVVRETPENPVFSYSPTAIDFGSATHGAFSAPQNVLIGNNGNGIMFASDISFALVGDNRDEFDFDISGLPETFAAGEFAWFPVYALANTIGPINTTLRMSYDGIDYDLGLSAIGLEPGLVIIGNDTKDNKLPVNPYARHSYSQSIYLQENINVSNQRIEKISYYWNGYSTGNNSNEWIIYMGHTDNSVFLTTEDWVPLAQLTQVYAGVLDIPAVPGWIEITLHGPFLYNNSQNLVIAVDENSWELDGNYCFFHNTNIPGENRSIRAYGHTYNPDPADPAASSIQDTIAAYPNINMQFGDIPTEPIFVIEPTEYDFSEVQIETEVQKTFIIRNHGVGALQIAKEDISISGANADEFDLVEIEHDISLAANGEAEISLVFAPKTVGLKEAFLNISDNTGSGKALHSMRLEGEGIDHAIRIFPFFEGFEDGYTHIQPVLGNWKQILGPQYYAKYWTANNTYTDYNRSPRSGDWNAFLTFNGESALVRPIRLSADTEYMLKFYARQDGAINTNAKIKASLGTAATLAALNQVIIPETGLVNGDYQQIDGSFSVTDSGIYYIAIQAWLNASPWYISLDDISIHTILDAEPAPPILLAPFDGAEDLSAIGFELQWQANPAGGAPDDYLVYLSRDEQNILESDPFLTANTSYNPAIEGQIEFAYGETWYWTVKAINVHAEALSENVFAFTIESDPRELLPYWQDFGYDGSFPLSWSQTISGELSRDRWSVSNSNHAGGSAREMVCAWQNATGISRLISPPLNTEDTSKLALSFKHRLNPHDTGCTGKVQFSPDLINWFDTGFSFSTANSIPAQEVNLTITGLNASRTYIAWVMDGNHFQFNQWYLDDVNITATYDYPASDPVSIGADETEAIITITGGNASEVPAGLIPDIPNQISFDMYHSFVLEFFGSGPWTVDIVTGIPWLAFYQNGKWTALENGGIGFNFEIQPAKGGVQIPMTLGGGQDPTLPVELSSFTAILTADFFVKIAWMTESETNHAGYNILRSEVDNLSTAVKLNSGLISEGEVSGTQLSYQYLDSEVLEDAKYFYWLESLSLNGETDYYGPLAVSILAGGEEQEIPVIPLQTKLYSAFPNPFNPATNLRYSMKEAGDVSIQVFNIKGQLIQSFERSHEAPGYYQVSWNGRDQGGKPVTSGVYFYRMTSGKYSATKKMIMSK